MQALFIVDLQNDFLSKGAIPVPEGEKVIPIINEIQKQFSLVLASKDWHPKDHISFASTHCKQIGETIKDQNHLLLWPDHCIENSWGSEFPPDFDSSRIQKIFFKGQSPNSDSFSAFFEGKEKESGLFSFLKEKKVDQIFLTGLTLEHCVLATAIDSIHLGFQTMVIREGCAPFDLQLEKKTLDKLRKEGVKILSVKELLFHRK